MIGTYAPQVAYGYLEARLNSVEAVLKGEINDDLTDEDLVMQQLEQLPNVCRFVFVFRSGRSRTHCVFVVTNMPDDAQIQVRRPGKADCCHHGPYAQPLPRLDGHVVSGSQ